MKKEKLTYAEMLKDPRWQKKRLEVMQRDGFRCQHCLSEDRPLQVHHLVYDKDKKPWEYENDQLITLCEDCHQRETEENSDIYGFFKTLVNQFKKSKLSLSVLNYILGQLSEFLYSFNKNEEYDQCDKEAIKQFIELCIYSYGELGDVIIASKMGIDVKDYVKHVCPQILNEISKKED